MDRQRQPDEAGERSAWLEGHLLNWARWMHSQATVRNLSAMPLCIRYGRSVTYSTPWDETEDECDLKAAHAVDAVVRGLPPSQRAALLHTYLNAVFGFPRQNYEKLLAAAKYAVAAGLDRRGVP